MKRVFIAAVGLSMVLISSQNVWAKHPRPVPQAAQRPAMQAAANQGIAGRGHFRHHNDVDDFRFARTPYAAYPWYGPGIGYAPVIGYMPSGFVGNFGGGGGFSGAFFGSTVGGQDYFSSPAYGHWGGFGK